MSENLEENKSHDENDQSWWCRAHLRTKVGIGISGLYLLGIYITVSYRYADFSGLKLNEIGDFLAGVFAPLALLWLIIGYFQQGDELRQNSQALLLQAEELRQAAQHAGGLLEIAKNEYQLGLEIINADRAQSALREASQKEEAERERKIKIQPRFSFTTEEFNWERADIEMTNHGGDCSEFALEIEPNSAIKLLQPVEEARMNSHKSIIINIGLIAKTSNADTPVTLQWTDADGDRQIGRYRAVINRSEIKIRQEQK